MIEIRTRPIPERISRMFTPDVPKRAFLFAVLEGMNPGRVFADDNPSPSCAFVSEASGNTFASGELTGDAVTEVAAQLQANWRVHFTPYERDYQFFRSLTFLEEGTRLQFDGCPGGSSSLGQFRVGEGLDCRRMDRELLDRCCWKDFMQVTCGSLDAFLLNGIGLCLMKADCILTEAYAAHFGAGSAEIGVLTREGYRGKGYATVTCSRLIQLCAQRGCETYWCCDASNTASAKVARKLGYSREARFSPFWVA